MNNTKDLKTLIFYDKFNNNSRIYREDIERIVSIYKKYGYLISHEDALKAWECYSDSLAAEWIFLPEKDDLVFDSIFNYFIDPEAIDPNKKTKLNKGGFR